MRRINSFEESWYFTVRVDTLSSKPQKGYGYGIFYGLILRLLVCRILIKGVEGFWIINYGMKLLQTCCVDLLEWAGRLESKTDHLRQRRPFESLFCFWDLKAVDFLIIYNFSLTMPRIIVCNYICIYYIYIYTVYGKIDFLLVPLGLFFRVKTFSFREHIHFFIFQVEWRLCGTKVAHVPSKKSLVWTTPVYT